MGDIIFYDITPGAERELVVIRSGNTAQDRVNSIALNNDSTRCIVAFDESSLKIFDLTPGHARLIKTLYGHTQGVNSVSVNSDFTEAVSVDVDGVVKVWNLTSDNEHEIRSIENPDLFIPSIGVNKEFSRIIFCADEGCVKTFPLIKQPIVLDSCQKISYAYEFINTLRDWKELSLVQRATAFARLVEISDGFSVDEKSAFEYKLSTWSAS